MRRFLSITPTMPSRSADVAPETRVNPQALSKVGSMAKLPVRSMKPDLAVERHARQAVTEWVLLPELRLDSQLPSVRASPIACPSGPSGSTDRPCRTRERPRAKWLNPPSRRYQ